MRFGRIMHGLYVFLFLFLGAVPAVAWEGTVTRVLDGDSLRVRQGGQLVTLRLYGVDSPEYGQPSWGEAKDAVSGLVQGKMVTVQPMDTDQYGRIVALVGIRGVLVNGELVRRGLAWVYPHYCKMQPLCRELEGWEETARREGLGLWRERRPTPPWVWKHSRH